MRFERYVPTDADREADRREDEMKARRREADRREIARRLDVERRERVNAALTAWNLDVMRGNFR